MAGDPKPWPFLNATFNERTGAFSPDGHWVAYESNESGRSEVYVRPFPGPGGYRQQYDVAPDGRFLINVSVDESIAAPITVITNWHPEGKK